MRMLFVLLIAFLAAAPAFAQQRVALVIGNAAYDQPGWTLANPVNDARAVEAALAGVGFDVTVVEDASLREMSDAIAGFSRKLRLAGEDGVALFYYAGHGVQIDGLNFLVPTDADVYDDADVYAQAKRLNDVMSAMESGGTGVNFVILDACRNNPLPSATRGKVPGLAPAARTRGTLIAYATAPGAVTRDSPDAANSPFTSAFVRHLAEPGLAAETLFRRVATDVEAATDTSQQPWIESGLRGGDFCFAMCDDEGAGGGVSVEEAGAWAEATVLDTAEAYADFLERFPGSAFRNEARSRRDALTPQAPPAMFLTAGDPDEGGARTYAAGETFQDCDACPEMTALPAGSFMMGSPENEAGRFSWEGEPREVTLAAFAAGRYEVTRAEWRACVNAGACGGDALGEGSLDRLPVARVSWTDALDYIAWLNGQVDGAPYRLLTEAEWEYAARAGGGGRYSWGGEDPTCDAGAPNGANFSACDDLDGPSPAGSFAANAWGLFDVHGNVAEWVQDCYVSRYEGAPSDGASYEEENCRARVRRSGSFRDAARGLRAADRRGVAPHNRDADVGFRVARDLD